MGVFQAYGPGLATGGPQATVNGKPLALQYGTTSGGYGAPTYDNGSQPSAQQYGTVRGSENQVPQPGSQQPTYSINGGASQPTSVSFGGTGLAAGATSPPVSAEARANGVTSAYAPPPTYAAPTPAATGLATGSAPPPNPNSDAYNQALTNSPYLVGSAAYNARQNLAEQNVNRAYAGADQRAMAQGAMGGRVNSSGLALAGAERSNAMSSTLNGMAATAPTDQTNYLAGLQGLRTTDQTYNQANTMNPLYADQLGTNIAGSKQSQTFDAQLQPGRVQAGDLANTGTIQTQNFNAQDQPYKVGGLAAGISATQAQTAGQQIQNDFNSNPQVTAAKVQSLINSANLSSAESAAATDAFNNRNWTTFYQILGHVIDAGAAVAGADVASMKKAVTGAATAGF